MPNVGIFFFNQAKVNVICLWIVYNIDGKLQFQVNGTFLTASKLLSISFRFYENFSLLFVLCPLTFLDVVYECP